MKGELITAHEPHAANQIVANCPGCQLEDIARRYLEAQGRYPREELSEDASAAAVMARAFLRSTSSGHAESVR